MSSKIEEILAEEGAAAEQHDLADTMPTDITVARPNLTRPTVVSVRLSADEHARLQRAAAQEHLPVSTLLRIWALDRLRTEEGGGELSVAERLRRLEQAVFQHTV
ncbi:CopG domain protein DNA-binding domain protein [Acidimicrobium ferrooxidans DSM 10331]|uniref:CopG domain protein DNA-binding domain protein n=1 Tax=Acidimicrobium ferrooxidans (strain DSM 10331 / JCM 15462 / NBRC 103882 / ICP) TaxID=525909 RepID=C7M0R0_ACIFD|nr:CopG family transcriptional regulator [Acidimicrobium ferrooxidans]ACU54568.1 CopG domain protein DNA-binding domain protein [Acidimicrobium ferrooxidans DSM 10331]